MPGGDDEGGDKQKRSSQLVSPGMQDGEGAVFPRGYGKIQCPDCDGQDDPRQE
ncbi:hypothetical protein D3C73_1649180 [compost metagenome]